MPIAPAFRRACALLLAFAAPLQSAAAQVSRVDNTASLAYSGPSGVSTVQSNTVSFTVARAPRPTSISFRLAPPNLSLAGMKCEGQPLVISPVPVTADVLVGAPPLSTIDPSQPMVIVLDHPAANHDPDKREYETLSFEAGALTGAMPLVETAPDSGVFAGAVVGTSSDPARSGCDISRLRGKRIHFHYDGNDDGLPFHASVLIDPAGYVFDSRSGAPLDGATVSLIDTAGRPAAVFGDDGTSAYPSTMVTGAAVTDASGRRYPGLAGRYRFPLIAPGTYRLRVVPPGGYTAPSTRTPADLASFSDEAGDPYQLGAASYGEPFTVTDSDALIDIPVDPAAATLPLLLSKTASVRQASPGDLVEYRLHFTNRGGAVGTGVHVTDVLPPGLRYRRGSARGVAEPEAADDGRRLEFTLPALAAAATLDIRYAVSIAPAASPGETLNRAQAFAGGTPASNEAVAAVRIQPLLFTDALTVIGRVTEGDCNAPGRGRRGVAGIRILTEDGTTVVTDRDGLYHVEGLRPGRHVVQLDAAGLPPSHAPVACDNDTRQAGSATSRFVEGVGGVVKRVDFQLRPTGRAAPAASLPVTAVDDASAGGDRDWLAGQAPGIAWLFPAADHNPRVPTIRVAIKHRPGDRVALTVNGTGVDPLAFDATDTAGPVAVSRWSGIPLFSGDNRLVAIVKDAEGRAAATLERTVHVSGPAAHVALDPAHSRLVADGLTPPLLAMRVTDRAGRPVRAGTAVPITIDAPYRAASDGAAGQAQRLAGETRTDAAAQVVGDEGVAFVTLAPTTRAGALHARLTLADDKVVRRVPLRAWLEPAAQAWTVVGFGAGSLGYDTLARHARPMRSGGGSVADGQLALYAKGRIKGSWLLTFAYDSAHAYDPDRGLLGVVDPDRYYTVYGDGTLQAQDASTRRKLYLRLERRAFYALFGDFETGLTDTVLTRYSRTLSGLSAAYEGERVRAAGFAATTDASHVRDELRGNGLSGPYRLRARGIVPNSDKMTIEVRDRFRSERIVSSTPMARHLDYDIDPVAGTIRFRSPVLSRDEGLNPIYIVVDYEVEAGRSAKVVAGGRVAARIGAAELGASVLRDQTIGDATLIGLDARARIGADTELRGEVGTGGQGGLRTGAAFIVEGEHHGRGVDMLAYARQQDIGFGVGQQNAVEAGTRKIGLDGRVALTDHVSLTGTAWHQATLGTAGTRTAADLRIEYRRPGTTVFAGAQFAGDRGLDGGDRQSRLLTLGGSRTWLDGKLALTGQTQWAPGGDKASSDFPVRHQLTAAYRVKPGVRLVAGYEIADGADYRARTAQLGFDVAPWRGARLSSSLNGQAAGENGARTFAQYGLSQSLPIGRRWTLDATLDSATTVRGGINPGGRLNTLQPPASGSLAGAALVGDPLGGDYTAATLGAGYRTGAWSWNGRVEYRRADTSVRWGLTTNMLRALGEGRTLAATGKLYTLRDRAGAVASYAAGDLAIAIRPPDSRWSVLDRFSLRREQADAGMTDTNALGVPAFGFGDQATDRAINNLAINYRTGAEGRGHGWEATMYHGIKYVRGRFADELHDGLIDAVGFDLRRDLGRQLDVGVQGSVQHAWSGNAWAWSGGPSVGVSPARDWWISAGYNVAGYRDRDFGDDRYTRGGPYLTARMKFDGASLAGTTRALFGRR